MKKRFYASLVMAIVIIVVIGQTALAITVIPIPGTKVQINTGGLPGTSIREFSMIWQANDPKAGIIFFTQSATSPLSIFRAVTCDGGLTWTVLQTFSWVMR